MVVLLLAAAGVTGALLLRSDDAAVDSAQAPTGDLPAGAPATVASSPGSVVPDDVEAAVIEQVAALLSPTPTPRDELARALGLPIGTVAAALLELNLMGRAELLPGGLAATGSP
jgi:predicted Rossmann fold nucleotide-binding protein DprA/Smf involved in DNA uptake